MKAAISVIIPAFNGAAMIADAIASVRAQDIPCEVIVVDDGSSDSTAEVARPLADRLIRQPNRGIAAARNAGLAHAAGPYIAFIDVDDLWTDGKLALQLGMINSPDRPLAVTGYSVFRVVRADGWQDHPRPHLLLSLGASLLRREAFDRFGTFDESLECSEDLDWFLRLRDGGAPTHVHPEVVQWVRRHGANTTIGRDLRELQFIEVLKRSLDRRRRETRA